MKDGSFRRRGITLSDRRALDGSWFARSVESEGMSLSDATRLTIAQLRAAIRRESRLDVLRRKKRRLDGGLRTRNDTKE